MKFSQNLVHTSVCLTNIYNANKMKQHEQRSNKKKTKRKEKKYCEIFRESLQQYSFQGLSIQTYIHISTELNTALF